MIPLKWKLCKESEIIRGNCQVFWHAKHIRGTLTSILSRSNTSEGNDKKYFRHVNYQRHCQVTLECQRHCQPWSFCFNVSKIRNPQIIIFISGLGSHRLSVKQMQKARLSSYWRYTILNKSRCSTDQAKAYDENGMYIGIQRHAPYISTLSLPSLLGPLSGAVVISAAP